MTIGWLIPCQKNATQTLLYLAREGTGPSAHQELYLCQDWSLNRRSMNHGRKQTSRERPRSTRNMKYELLTKREVNIAGYWPRSFFVCLWTGRSRGPWRKRKRPISRNLGRISLSIKDLLYSNNNNKFSGKSRAIPGGQDRPIFFARAANHNTVFTSSCPLACYNRYLLIDKLYLSPTTSHFKECFYGNVKTNIRA